MAAIQKFEDLEMWQKSRVLCKDVFEIISDPVFSSDYKLKNQINGSSGSIMDNIAEGFGRESRLEFINFLSIAKASCAEVRSQLYRALDRRYISVELFNKMSYLAEEISKMITAFMVYLNKSTNRGNKFRDRAN